MGLFTYHRESDLSNEEIYAGLAAGTLKKWHRDIHGEQWFKRAKFPEIHGVPAEHPDAIAADVEDADIVGDDVGEIEIEDIHGHTVTVPAIIRGPSAPVQFDFGG